MTWAVAIAPGDVANSDAMIEHWESAFIAWKESGGVVGSPEHVALLRAQAWQAWHEWAGWRDDALDGRDKLRQARVFWEDDQEEIAKLRASLALALGHEDDHFELCSAHGQLVLSNEARRSEKLPDAIKRIVQERDEALSALERIRMMLQIECDLGSDAADAEIYKAVALAIDGRDAAMVRAEEAQKNYQWMVERAADGLNGNPSLDGYRELGARAAAAEERAEKAERVLRETCWKQNGGGTYSCNGCGSWSFVKVHYANCPIGQVVGLGERTEAGK